MTSTSWAIDLTHVEKVYKGKVHALRGIEMRVHAGEVFGLLGPNGAGKSTLVKILMTVISATRADGTMLGRPIGDKHTLSRVGYLPEHHRFPEYLTGGQVLDFFGALSGVPRADCKRRSAELLDLVGMTAWRNHRVKGYSKGMRQRIGIAQALMSDPDLVILDEPTDGVDPVGRRDIRSMVTRLRERGKTVFLNSHLLSELEMVCDRVAILVQGRVASQGTVDDLTRFRQFYEIEVVPTASGAAADLLLSCLPGPAAASLAPVGGGRTATRGMLDASTWVELDGATLRVGTQDPASVAPLIDRVRQSGLTLRALRPVRPSLEDLFMEAVTDPTTGRAKLPGADSAEARP
ncbi:MAG: ABC transporter ATP-binding protein [Phycisphaerales bacterium]|nr:ABC transporter ATP-binding protein [Phycisphaerales bacterium]